MINLQVNMKLLQSEVKSKFRNIASLQRACIDVDQATLSLLWGNKSKGISAIVLYRVSKALDLPMETFITKEIKVSNAKIPSVRKNPFACYGNKVPHRMDFDDLDEFRSRLGNYNKWEKENVTINPPIT